MDIYITKKVDSSEDFSLMAVDTLPTMHIITPPVLLRRAGNGNLFISDVEGGTSPGNVVQHVSKLKKIVCKQFVKNDAELSKYKLADEVVWVHPSPIMCYKKDNMVVSCSKLLLNVPLQLQLSCKPDNVYVLPKPYNVYNMTWTIEYIMVDKSFDWATLANE